MRFLAFTLLLPALAFSAQRFDLTTTEKVDLAPGGTVRIEGSTGELNVEGWDGPGVEVQLTRYAWGENEQKTKAALGRIQMSKQVSGNVLTLSTVHKRFSDAKVDYRIRVPHNTNLVIHHGSGDVTVYDVGGNIEATAKEGDVVVQLAANAKYAIDAHTSFGTIYSDFAGVEHKPLRVGETLKPASEGSGEAKQIHLHTVFGGITIQKVQAWPLLSLNQL
jgi:hypothetical protein